MADSPFTSKASDKRTSLAEMAARAAKRASRPPPAPSDPPSRDPGRSFAPPPPSSAGAPPLTEGNGSGLINLRDVAETKTLAPAVRALDDRSSSAHATPAPAQAEGGSSVARGVLAGATIAILAMGIAYGLTTEKGDAAHDRETARAPAVTLPQASPQPAQPAAAAPAPAPAPTAAVAAAAQPAATALGTVSPAEPTEITGHVRHARVAKTARKPAGGAAEPAHAGKAPDPTPAAEATPPPAPAAPAAPATPEPTGLAGAMKKAVGPTEAPVAAAQAPEPAKPAMRGDIPETPAQGAIQGAIATHRAAARGCVAGHEAPSRATITFASTGAVQSVAVTGPAAGTPAEACIKTALSKSTVGAFRRPTFSISTTVSPP